MPEPKKTPVTSTTPELDWQHFYRAHPTKSPSEIAALHIGGGVTVPLRERLPRLLLTADACIAAVAVITILVKA